MYRIFCIIIIGFSFTILSCNNNEENVTRLEDTNSNNFEISIDSISKNHIADTSLSDFVRNQLSEYDIINNDKNDKFHVLENSKYERSQYAYLKKQTSINYGDVEGIYPKINLFLYKYTDSLICENTFAEWLKTIGDDDKIKVMENKDSVKTPPIFALKSANVIFVLYYLCEHQENNWEDVKEKMKEYFKDKKYITMNIECGGPLKWN